MCPFDGEALDVSAIFREANERIRATARELGLGSAVPFICECPDRGCTDFVRLDVREYDALRGDRGSLVALPGHTEPTEPVGSSPFSPGA